MRFDEGINAAFVNYSYSTDANNGDGAATSINIFR